MGKNTIVLIIISLFFFQKTILFFQYKIVKKGYDHFFHFALINGIRANSHQFLNRTTFRLNGINFAYPQFYHWLLSFLPEKFIKEKYNRIGQVINFLTIVSFVIFAYTIYDFLQLEISRELFVFYSGLAFTLSPFNYLLWNAKNRGLSVRGFGLLLANLFVYSIVWLNLYENVWFYVPIFAIAFIILLSSQFAFQFVLLASPFLTFFFKDYILILPPFVAAILYLIFFRKIAVQFFKGQYYHKKIWFKYLSKNFVLNKRYSIYRDFFWDFWKKRDMKYFLNNPIVTIVLGFPFISAVFFFILKDYTNIPVLLKNQSFYILFIPNLIGIIAFFLTSFRPTRFFGEPERYVEFALPFFSVLSIVYLQNYEWLIAVLICFSFIYIMYQYSLFGFQTKNDLNVYVEKLKSFLSSNYKLDDYKLFSNSVNILNFFIDNEKIKILFPNITSEYTGKFHFKEIYPKEFPRVNSKVIIPLIIEYKIDWFILDTLYINEREFNYLEKNNLNFEKLYTYGQYILFKIT